jgi:hypothetical protein
VVPAAAAAGEGAAAGTIAAPAPRVVAISDANDRRAETRPDRRADRRAATGGNVLALSIVVGTPIRRT